ncbi:helix-turn-helix transcriptional regulator [Actinomadura adrarensis]|uniref:Helix-turn-helix transcriptional regulator n=1 Tax=Actinomadura adrarensis TaxID=1819600 RepID=A0ABW3CGZ3_9ACTN
MGKRATTPPIRTDDQWHTAAEVVERYKLASVSALYTLRSRGRGPKGHRFGRELRFRDSDLAAWEAACADPVDA